MRQIAWLYDVAHVAVPARTGESPIAPVLSGLLLAAAVPLLFAGWIVLHWWPLSMFALVPATAGFWGLVVLSAADVPDDVDL